MHIDRYIIPVTIGIVALSAIPIALEARKHRRKQRAQAAAVPPLSHREQAGPEQTAAAPLVRD